MTISERKAREKENLRNLILQGAKRLFLEKGIEHTTIRNIADSIDYSVGTVYVYFKDKKAILHAIHSSGFQQLGGYFGTLSTLPDPMERLQKMGVLYMKFALENPEMYDLMFTVKAPIEYLDDCEDEQWEEGEGTFDALRQTVKECIDKGHFSGHDLEPLSFMIWSLVHGMCSLEIRQRTKGVKFEHADTIVWQGYQQFVLLLNKL
jgi:AcrR family transcriptional regulator